MKILIIKIGALGDVLRTTFIAQALKDKFQKENPAIFWLTDEKAKPMFINNPYVDKVYNSQNKNLLCNQFFDIVINLEEDEATCKFASSLNFSKIIGFIYKENKINPTPAAKEWFAMSALGKKPENNILKKKNKKTHRQIMSEIIGVDKEKYEPFLRLTEKQRTLAKNFLRIHNLSKNDLIIGINTGSAERWPKYLSIRKTAGLIEKIYKEFNAKILLFGGPNEVERNREIMKLSKSPVISTGCGNNLYEFPALISACNIFITTDTLGLHIALALKRRVIVLIGPTSYSEIDMYGLGEKVVAKSQCICCYKKDCKSMEKINLEEIIYPIKKFGRQKITLVITAFKEPKIASAIESAINQKTKYEYDILIVAPDDKTLSIAKSYSIKNKKVNIFRDPGKGKMYAISLLLNKIKSDILILTDGDVYISDNSVEEIANLFLNSEIGAVTGRPVPIENRKTKYGYWANFLFHSAHKLRKEASNKADFIECSGYLFAFRNGKIKKLPLDTAEDTIIPYFFWEKGYQIEYAEKALVYVKNVDNWKEWISQKTRTSKAHETLYKYADVKTTPRVKSFSNEVKGIFELLKYPQNFKEFYWSILLAFSRLLMWAIVFYKIKARKQTKIDGWRRVESAR